ncbi:TonB family protein [Nonlabens marinus S1-08]|uniref:TonB family protein n=2 Tax=Nonlabens TaxID=363408 RepID=W8W0G5_9FLAO|nr:TonB family protein [Nonlabens marinus S1-08]
MPDLNKKEIRLLNKTLKAYSAQNFEKALDLVKESMASEELEKLGLVHMLEGNIYFALEDLELAKASYLKAIQLSKPNDPAISIAQVGLARSMEKINIRKEIEAKKKFEIEKQSIKKETDSISEITAFAIIEQVPVFPGCESGTTNAEYKRCMQKGITTHVSNNFRASVAGPIGLSGRININVQFKIDKSGEIIGINAQAVHPILEEEAIRVIERLPKMQPGRQKGKPVGVIYGLPIIFDVK